MRDQDHTQHLTDAEFSQLLDGAQPGSATAAHLEACDFCRQELDAVGNALGDFRGLSAAWAELEAPRRIPVPARWLERMQWRRSWIGGLAATAATGVLAFWMGFAPQANRSAPQLRQHPAPSTADLAADNRLLLSIDTELSDQAQLLEPASFTRPSSPHAHRPVGVTTN